MKQEFNLKNYKVTSILTKVVKEVATTTVLAVNEEEAFEKTQKRAGDYTENEFVKRDRCYGDVLSVNEVIEIEEVK